MKAFLYFFIIVLLTAIYVGGAIWGQCLLWPVSWIAAVLHLLTLALAFPAAWRIWCWAFEKIFPKAVTE